jgi:hypothetical protein
MDGFYNRHSVYCAVRTGSLNEIFCLMGLITILIFLILLQDSVVFSLVKYNPRNLLYMQRDMKLIRYTWKDCVRLPCLLR